MTRRFLFAVFALSAGLTVHAADWPQFRGPNRDDVSTEKGLLTAWPEKGPPLVFEAKGLGGGYSTVSIVGDRIYTLGNKEKTTAGKENKQRVTFVQALDRDTGKIVWSSELGPQGGNLGCTPTVEGGHVYALGQGGDLVCFDAKDGSRVWARNLMKDFGGQVGGWHYCESPLVDGDKVIITPGGAKATMVALNKKTGETIWQCPIALKHPVAGYSSVVIARIGGVKLYVQTTDGGIIGVRDDGKLQWTNERFSHNTANIPTPIVLGDQLFCSVGYGKGAVMLKLKADKDTVSAEEVYYKRELTNKHGGVVCVGDYLYGDTDDSGRPFCADVKTGKVMWKRERQGAGEKSVSVTYADGHLYFHYENGVVALVKASPDKYEEVGSFHVPKTNGPSWAHPVIAGGRLFLREGDALFCYDVRAK
jgi:outer membrane protein assembly factor BamB